MPDIALCPDETCPKKETCYRFFAKPDKYWQSYFTKSPRVGDKCEHYWEEKPLKRNIVNDKLPNNITKNTN